MLVERIRCINRETKLEYSDEIVLKSKKKLKSMSSLKNGFTIICGNRVILPDT